jgi:phospholipase/carboxylesterase
MKYSLHILFVLFIGIGLQGCAQEPSVLTYEHRAAQVDAAHPPLLILLHGVGSNEQDLFSLADYLPKKYVVISVRAPITLGANSYGWFRIDRSSGTLKYDFKEVEASREKLVQFIAQMKKEHGSPESKVYLCGFSQGAIMSYNLALTHPELISGIAAMSGRLMEEIKPLAQSKDKLAHLNIHISHGTGDQILPHQGALEAKAYLESLGLKPSFHSYTAGHEINREILQDLIKWLE